MAKVAISDDELKRRLTPEQYAVLCKSDTEAPFSGEYLEHDEEGIYKCIVCSAQLFSSKDKYESDIDSLKGWPSFADVVEAGVVQLKDDVGHGMYRTEVVCASCGGHLGHLFDDASSPSKKHYCINSVALDFKREE